MKSLIDNFPVYKVISVFSSAHTITLYFSTDVLDRHTEVSVKNKITHIHMSCMLHPSFIFFSFQDKLYLFYINKIIYSWGATTLSLKMNDKKWRTYIRKQKLTLATSSILSFYFTQTKYYKRVVTHQQIFISSYNLRLNSLQTMIFKELQIDIYLVLFST